MIEMPQGAETLCVQMQGTQPCIWAKVDDAKPMENRMFHVRGTGHLLQENEGKYIGTFQMLGGSLIFHVFEHK